MKENKERFVLITEADHPYECMVDVDAIVKIEPDLRLIRFHNQTTLQLTKEAFERVKKIYNQRKGGKKDGRENPM
jgi:PHD/YefM family antitoxin component YafN of YafNO toxin-antitoxin module